MHFASLALAALMSLAQAVKVQVVAVGKNPVNNQTGLKYYPDTITAEPGSMVQFQFWVGNHTATQSTFDNPCQPISQVEAGQSGIWSGFMPVAAGEGTGMIPVFTVQVNDTKPIWIFCSQGPHCEMGMAMVINQNTTANSTRSLDNYKAAAAKLSGGSAGSGSGSSGGSYGGGGYGGYPAGGSGSGAVPTSAGGSEATGTGSSPAITTTGGVTVGGASKAGLSGCIIITLFATILALL